MGEGMHSMAAQKASRGQKRWMLLLAGSAALVVVAGFMMQVNRPTSAYPADAKAAGSASLSGAAAAPENAKSQRALAKVGKQYITWDEVADEAISRHGEEVLENMVNRAIIQQACAKYGIEVTEAEVDAEILKISKKFSLAVDQWLQMLKAERGLTAAQYRRDIIWPMLALRKLAGENVAVTKEDLQKAFIRNYGPRVKARAIVLDNPRRAAEIWEKARANPDEFARLARQHSVDPASRPLDGAVPPIRQHGGAPELEKAAFKLQPGEVSGVIQVGVNQYVILLCEGYTEQVVTELSEVEAILKQELHDEKVNESVAKVFEKLKADARVDNYLTGISSGGERQAAPTRRDGGVTPTGATSPATKRPAGRTAATPAQKINQ